LNSNEVLKFDSIHVLVDPMKVEWISFFLFGIAALIHFGFFFFEAILYQRRGFHEKLRISERDHELQKVWAFNQGFYNLYLSVGTLTGLYFVMQKQIMLAGVLTSFCGVSMIVSGCVLWLSVPRLRVAALVQAIPPMLGFLFLSFHIVK
jgi:putative membrane protein